MTASLLVPPLRSLVSPTGARIGCQAPRLRSVPDYTSTLGPEAIDLAAAAGLTCDPWQCDVVCDILGTTDGGLWSAFETCTIAQRQQGKGGIIETIELGGLFLFGERLILHSAHEYKTAQEAFLRIKALIDGCADLSRYVKAIREANGEQQIILMDGARLRFVARSKGSGRGFTGQRNILDEAYALTFTQLAALLPTMSAQPNPQMNLFSTVPDIDTMPAAEDAVLPGVHQRALEAAESGDPGRLAYHDWSMRRGEDPFDVEVWYACNPALGIRIAEDYVRAELAALGPAKFSIERLGLWPSAEKGWRVVTEDQWRAAANAGRTVGDPVSVAVDVTPDRKSSCIAVAGPCGDGDIAVEIVEHATGTSWVVPRVVGIVAKWKPCRLVVNAAGAAASMTREIEDALAEAEVGIEVTSPNARDENAAYGMVFDALTRPDAADREGVDEDTPPWRLWHRDDPRLTAAVAAARTRKVGSEGTTWDWLESVDQSPLKAATHAVWGYVTRPLLPDVQPMVLWL